MKLKEIEENLFKRLYKGAYLERHLMSFFFIYQGYKYKLEEFKELKLEKNNPDIQRLLEESKKQCLIGTLTNLRLILMDCDNFIIRSTLEKLNQGKIKNYSKETSFLKLLHKELEREEQELENYHEDEMERLKSENKQLKEKLKIYES